MSGQVRLLPVLICVAVLAFGVRLLQVYTGVAYFSGIAMAESEPPKEGADVKTAAADTPPESELESTKTPEEQNLEGEAKVAEGEKKAEEDLGAPPQWRDASDSDVEAEGVKMELFKEVSEKGKKLDQMEKDLNVREALLKAASQELERKFQELEKLRKEIEGLLGKQSEEEDKRIASLVKIYEGMKPVDAARIFDTLDLDVLVAVMSRMSERKISPVLAAMSAERARTITIMLAEQKKLPELPQ